MPAPPSVLPGDLPTIVVPARAEGERLDLALAALRPDLSRRAIRAAIARGEVELSGKVVRVASRPVAPGDRIRVAMPLPAPEPPPLPFPRLAAGHDWAAFDKPAGMLSEPSSTTGIREATTTALERARQEFARAGDERPFAACVGRLDRPVSGILLVARSGKAHGRLVAALARPTARKGYLALVDGPLPGDEGRIEMAIRRTGASTWAVVPPGEPIPDDARPCTTGWRRLAASGDLSLVAVRLLTGRTHQARLHLSALGAPVHGETRYPVDAALGRRLPGPPPERVLLHCARLEFDDGTGRIVLRSPLPADFADALRSGGLAPEAIPEDPFDRL